MRHGASFISAMEGISRPAFLIARELSVNSRSGLTVRFLSKKLELPEEEVEYLVDINHKLFFFDLTKVKLVAEGFNAVKRIGDGLENLGDIASLYRLIKALDAHDFRRLEEQIGIGQPGGKKGAAEALVEQCYCHPDSVVEYVASRGFSERARELFDLIWQSPEGIMPVSALRAAHGGSEYEIEQALWQLFRGFVSFEMFRFDQEDRLVRAAGLLAEVRQWRDSQRGSKAQRSSVKSVKATPGNVASRGLDLSERVCRLVAAIAAHPVRLRGDGDLFREDYRRLCDICPEDVDPPLATCLWIAQGVGWLARVDNELRAAELKELVGMTPLARHRILSEWLLSAAGENTPRAMLAALFEEAIPGAWYPIVPFVQHAMRLSAEHERPVLRQSGAHCHYVSPSTAPNADRILVRALEETLLWLGVVDRGEEDGDGVFRLTELGTCLLQGKESKALETRFAPRGAQFIVQPNFDIVVPSQDTDPLLTVPLDQFAERKSTGQATLYTLSKESFTRGIQEGHDGDAFVNFLLRHNRGDSLPSNVMTTLDDWRGGVKRVQLKTVQVLEADDPLVIADLLHRRGFKKCLQGIDPRLVVLVNKISKAELAKELEKEGFVVE